MLDCLTWMPLDTARLTASKLISLFLTQPYQRGVSLFLLTSLTTTLKALDQWSEKFLCPGKNSKYFQLWRSCLLCYLYAILLLWNESKHRQHVNQRVWLYSNKTLGMDTEVWISRWNKQNIIFPQLFKKVKICRASWWQARFGGQNLLSGALEASWSLPFLAPHPTFSSWPCLSVLPPSTLQLCLLTIPCHWSSFFLLGWLQ